MYNKISKKTIANDNTVLKKMRGAVTTENRRVVYVC